MDIDGNIIAESLKGETYPSIVREIEQELQLEAKSQEAESAEKAEAVKAEQEAQAEWDAMREQMMKTAASMGALKKRG